MSVKFGIVGLPNVGKSTLFNAITNSEVEAANYPFATIEPNIGVVELVDDRLLDLADAFKSKKIIQTQVEFVDIAGLIEGASKGEGLGNKFLTNIREVDAIVNVVRIFENKDIIHVNETIDPIRDIETIKTELIISDYQQLQNWLQKSQKKILSSGTQDEKTQVEIAISISKHLEQDKMASEFEMSPEDEKLAKHFNLLTMKPSVYVANVGEDELGSLDSNKKYEVFVNYMNENSLTYVTLSSQIEYEISKLENDERQMFIDDLSLGTSGLNKLSTAAFKELEYMLYFTVGPEEARAWPFRKGTKAPGAAGIIHTDFEKGFIKAEIYSYEDFKTFRSESELKANGKIRLEGKEYEVADGDVCHFRFNV